MQQQEAWLYCTKRGRARSDVMPEFNWTGPLRPYRISTRRPVSRLLRSSGYHHCLAPQTKDKRGPGSVDSDPLPT